MLLMCRMKNPLWVTGKIVIMDNGFCVIKGLMVTYYRVVYVSTMVKNHKYWPRRIYGDKINAHFEKKKIGEHECHSRNWKEFYFAVFVVKEKNYNIIMMST